jgi:hypothetical protein
MEPVKHNCEEISEEVKEETLNRLLDELESDEILGYEFPGAKLIHENEIKKYRTQND